LTSPLIAQDIGGKKSFRSKRNPYALKATAGTFGGQKITYKAVCIRDPFEKLQW